MDERFLFCRFIFQGTRNELERMLETSCTLYIGNLSFYTTEEQIYELFSRAGDLKRIVMGLDKVKKTPCGFCFVEYPVLLNSGLFMSYESWWVFFHVHF